MFYGVFFILSAYKEKIGKRFSAFWAKTPKEFQRIGKKRQKSLGVVYEIHRKIKSLREGKGRH